MHNDFIETIIALENYCSRQHIDHRFVGGVSFGGLLNKKTSWEIDVKRKKVTLSNPNKIDLLRPDGTRKDIDMITLDGKTITQKLLKQTKITVVIEPAKVYPQTIDTFRQFVTDIYRDQKDRYFLTFGPIKQEVNQKSFEAWTVVYDDLSYTVRNPIADYFAYQFRSPAGIKQKDKEKVMLLKKLADEVILEGKENDIDYLGPDYFGTWQLFVQKLQTSYHPSVVFKRWFMRLYWQTVGEYLAHGKGFTRYFLSLQNKFTG